MTAMSACLIDTKTEICHDSDIKAAANAADRANIQKDMQQAAENNGCF